jgi:serine/threonine-protein kinase
VLPHLVNDPEFERMLADEARIASGVRHPNVCEIYDLGEERHVLYIAMEWVYGDSVSHLVKASGTPSGGIDLDPRVVARIVSDAAAGLHAAHNLVDDDGRALHVVHRDVSPHNLLVSLDGTVKVTDFGVAKAVGASHESTSAGQLKGKVAYMAPEQATGQPVDRRSDVFALGCVLYEATTGQRPFRGEGEHQVMQELVKGAFARPSRLVRGYPFELERIVTRALAPQPLHRFQTMEQMRTALEEWISKSGPVVTQSQVAGIVKQRLGAEVEKRRARIRAASAEIAERGEAFDALQMTPSGASVRPMGATPSGVVPMREGSVAPPAPERISHVGLTEPVASPPVIPLAPRAPSAPQYFIAGAIGVLTAAVVGVAGFYVWRGMTPAPSPTRATAFASPESPPPVLAAASAAPASSAGLPAVPPAIAHPAAPIVFKVIPDKAYFVVDGSATEPTVRTLDRPASGSTRTLVVRADGYVDQTLTLDDSAPASIDVWLDAVPKKSASQAKTPPSDATSTRAPEALPANPY